MLILTEKPSVAQSFAEALNCTRHQGFYKNSLYVITNCLGHLLELAEPEVYDPKYKSWDYFPVIPDSYRYVTKDKTRKQAELVIQLLKDHRDDQILIATDADREGEIIARECLLLAGISDFSKIRRFWVSQALTKDVILQGINDAKPLKDYNFLGSQGFARQHGDWLVGYNFVRYLTKHANRKLSVGRVRTAVLQAIEDRCREIAEFSSKKYFEFFGVFQHFEKCFRGIHYIDETSKFPDEQNSKKLELCRGKQCQLAKKESKEQRILPPLLYSLNDLQKDAFRIYSIKPDETLETVQSLYETHKCVSYPRTPSNVMGSKNVELCKQIFSSFARSDTMFRSALETSDITLSNTRCFNDAKLDSHHALIPLSELPPNTSEKEKLIYNLILRRFLVAFNQPFVYNKQTVLLNCEDNLFRINGRSVISKGWKNYVSTDDEDEDADEENQDLPENGWDNVIVKDIETKQKWTKPPKHYTDGSILAFMENPTQKDTQKKLVGLGTPATRHTFVPELVKSGFCAYEGKNLCITDLGSILLKAIRGSSLSSLTDIEETTKWEEKLEDNPSLFEEDIIRYVREACSQQISLNIPPSQEKDDFPLCPACKKGRIRKSKTKYFCTGYKDGCSFSLWDSIAGSSLTNKDIEALCKGKKTRLHDCTSKAGKVFKTRFALDEQYKIKFVFD